MIDREAALAASAAVDAQSTPVVPVKLKPWFGFDAFVKSMTVADSNRNQGAFQQVGVATGLENATLFASVICNEDGSLIFDPFNASDVKMISKKKATLGKVIWTAIAKANGDDIAALGNESPSPESGS